MKLVFLGLSITSSWGNGHATNYRALLKALRRRGHDALFLERDVPWYAAHRDASAAGELYSSVDELRQRFADAVRDADLVVVGSYVPNGVAVAEWMVGCRLDPAWEMQVVEPRRELRDVPPGRAPERLQRHAATLISSST